jgi:hypothetical protein
MRLRLPELLAERDMTPYQLAARSGGRIPLASAYRLQKAGGRFSRLSPAMLAALLEVLEVTPDQLFEVTPPKKRR